MKRAFLLGLTALTFTTASAAANAQGYEHRFFGRVVSFQPYNLQLERGPHIFLHNGTVLRPRGLNLQSGMPVMVIGHRDVNGSFQADEIELVEPHERPPRRYWPQ